MTVKELKEQLKDMPDDYKVMVEYYTDVYGITIWHDEEIVLIY